MTATSSPTDLMARAVERLALGAPFMPAELTLLVDGTAAILERPPLTDEQRSAVARLRTFDARLSDRPALFALADRVSAPAERRLVDGVLGTAVSRGLATFGPNAMPEPKPDPALERRIAEAAAAAEALRLVERLAWDRRLLADVAVRKAQTQDQAKAAAATVAEALEAWRGAEQAWIQAGRAVLRLQRRRDARRQAEVTEPTT